MKRNLYAMTQDELVSFIQEEVNTFKAELGTAQSIASGYQKVKLSEIQQYSNFLQRPAVSNEHAAALKAEIDSFLNQYRPTAMVRNVEQVNMTQYWKHQKQFQPNLSSNNVKNT